SSCSDWLGYTLKRKLTNQENPLTRNSSCSDWLGYTLKRKLTNQENPLTHNNEYDVGLLE
ncbi:hypothetical protein AAH030_11340, partial [Phocaeicola vulgatus]|uniref:hypothetical protein n=1 Tax=Phocaeicola vulgatus TaxID=821 RepID=UPI0039B50427